MPILLYGLRPYYSMVTPILLYGLRPYYSMVTPISLYGYAHMIPCLFGLPGLETMVLDMRGLFYGLRLLSNKVLRTRTTISSTLPLPHLEGLHSGGHIYFIITRFSET